MLPTDWALTSNINLWFTSSRLPPPGTSPYIEKQLFHASVSSFLAGYPSPLLDLTNIYPAHNPSLMSIPFEYCPQ